MNILEKRQAIRKAVCKMGLLKKEGKNDYFRYQHLTANQLKIIFNKLFVKHGLEFDPTIESVEFFPGTEARPFGLLVKVRMLLHDVDNPGENMDAVFYGESISNNSTGLYSAVTGAVKSYLENTFLVVGEDDPELTFTDPTPQTNIININEMTPEQKKIIDKLTDQQREEIIARYGSLNLCKRDASAVLSKLQNEGKLPA